MLPPRRSSRHDATVYPAPRSQADRPVVRDHLRRGRGKGSHVLFLGPDQSAFPVPSHSEVTRSYINRFRRRFGLTSVDGITDEDFFSR